MAVFSILTQTLIQPLILALTALLAPPFQIFPSVVLATLALLQILQLATSVLLAPLARLRHLTLMVRSGARMTDLVVRSDTMAATPQQRFQIMAITLPSVTSVVRQIILRPFLILMLILVVLKMMVLVAS